MTKSIVFISILLIFLSSCTGTKELTESYNPAEELYNKELPYWARNANIYEVNIRQYTDEGTIQAFSKHLQRLSIMGVDIIWLTPIFPISETNRKGELGSHDAVSDYKAINPEFGTMEDFDTMVKKIHDLGMYVILDWVPSHTGLDHDWIERHPEWYAKDDLGKFINPTDTHSDRDRTDLAVLDYDNEDLWSEIIDAKLFWLKEHAVDGFREDSAMEIPDAFWKDAAYEVFYVGRPIFMLAESAHPPHRNQEYFHMTYGSSFNNLLIEIAQGKKSALDLKGWHKEDKMKFQKGFQMNFITNQDVNSLHGSVYESMSEEAEKAMFALCSTFEGMPLLSGGQEEPLKHRLRVFDKDTIGFEKYENKQFYYKLFKHKHENQAIWNGSYGGPAEVILCNEQIFAFKREMNGHSFYGIFNLSNEATSFNNTFNIKGRDVMRNSKADWGPTARIGLQPWEFHLISDIPSKK